MIRIISLLIIVTLMVTSTPAQADNRETMRLLNLFGDVFEKVREEYVEAPADKELIESAINGMLTDLDPHSSFLNEESFKEMQIQTSGEFGGLGIEVTMRNGLVYVVSPIDDTPAFNAGLKAGDYISHIDGEAVIGMKLRDAVKKMRGKPKTDITLTILREGAEQPFDVVITRDIIKIRTVRSRLEDDVIYLRVTSFTEKTGSGLKKELKKQHHEIGDKLKGVVLDLRNNPGGLLNQAIEVADMFMDHGEIVSTRGRDPKNVQRFNAASKDLIEGLPIVVLINGGSASASEIVAGALQDHGRAIIMGTKSFGKGSVQTIIPLPGDSAIRLTTSRYYTPSGKSIQAKGIDPDIIVEPANIEFLKQNGKLMSEAALRGHLDNGNKAKPANDNVSEDMEKKIKDATGEKKDGKSSLYEEDYQLARAIDLLRGVYIFKRAGMPITMK